MGFLVGWLAPFVLLTATFNPTGVSSVAWARDAWREATPSLYSSCLAWACIGGYSGGGFPVRWKSMMRGISDAATGRT